MGKRPGGSSSAHSENAVEPCAYSRPGATPKPLASPLAANRVPPAICGICTAPAVRGAYENVGGEQFYSTFESAHFRAPSHLPQPGFRPRARGDHRCAALPVGRDVERPASATDRGRRAFRRCGRPHLLGGVVVAVAVDRRAEPLTGEIIMDSKTWPCAVIAILMCAAGTMSQAQESGPPQPTPRDDPATSGAGPTSRAPGQFDYDPPKGASVTTDQRGHTTTNSTSGGSTPGNPPRDQGNDSIDAIAPKN